jgi:hypothetical protein
MKFQQKLRAIGKQCGRIPVAIVCAVSIAGCHSLQPSRRSAGLPSPPGPPSANASLTGERKVLLDQLHRMAQEDAGTSGR